MVSNKLAIGVVLMALVLAVLGATDCSTFCSTSGCSGTTRSDCNTKCYTGWTWYAGSSTCDFDPITDQLAVIDSSDDSGGDAYVTPFTGGYPTICVDGGLPDYYGGYWVNETVTVTSPMGTYLPHYQIDLYFNIILQDVDDGSVGWGGGPSFTATLTTSNSTESKTENVETGGGGGGGNNNQASGKTIQSYNGACGRTDKKDNFQRLLFTGYTHNLTGTAINISISATNNKQGAVWRARVFIFVARLCNQYCLSCFGKQITKCYSCSVADGYMLSGTTCATSCLPGYGPKFDPAICVLCLDTCTACFDLEDNCTACTTSGANEFWLYYNSTLDYSQCLSPCPIGTFENNVNHTCDLCHNNCTSCGFNDTHCYSCVTGFGWNGYSCWMPCPTSYFYENGDLNCTKCPNECFVCANATSCSVCTTTGPNTAYLLVQTCYNNCPAGYYEDTNSGAGPNLCLLCHGSCATCTNNPTPCQSCTTGFFHINDTCPSTCPDGYVAFSPTNQCLLCDTYCVDLTISFSFSDSMSNQLYVDMQFTRALDFNTFDYQNFQTITITNQDIANYDVTYTFTSSSSYRITLSPKGFVFLYNQTVSVLTVTPPSPYDTSADTMPFKATNYQKSAEISWFLMKSPEMSQKQYDVINGLSGVNGMVIDATTVPFIAQIKKSGVFCLLFAGAQLTSSTILINTVPPQNMYEGVRFWATPIFYDVPPWQQISSKPNNFFGNEMYELTLNQRRLFQLNSIYWRFQRTGMTSFFLYDVYIPLLLIGTAWLSLAIYNCIKKRQGDAACCKKHRGFFFTILHKLHEICLLYVTIAMMMEWLFFDAGSLQRWISMGMCLLFTCYFVGYHLYIYYDMIRYPEAIIGNDQYEYYVLRYSTFLKNIRYEEYDMKEPWSIRHWFRPYNYHLLSYYKKFCMMVALPVFYQAKHWQISVLILIQALEIARFVATKPYVALWRNVYRFVLELVVFAFFFCILACELLMDEIVKDDPNTLQSSVNSYYGVGWFGFVLVWTFNIGFIVLTIIDVVLGCRRSNRQMMDEARRIYYYDKVVDYEKEKDQVPLALMNKWVKLGNLNDRNQAELPDINVRIEYYKMIKHGGYYDVEVLKTVQLYMNTDFNFHQQNNTTPGKQIKKRIKLSKQVSKPLFNLVNQLYQEHAKKDTEAMIIKTFVFVEQREFKAGDRVPLVPDQMMQKIQLENFSGDKESIRLKHKIKGFPLNPFDLQSI